MAPIVPRVRFLWKIPLTLKEKSHRCCWRNACFTARNEKAFKSSVDFPLSENWAVTAGQNSSPGARLTSPVTVGDKVCVTCGSSVPQGGGRKEALSSASLFSPLRLEMLWRHLHNTWGGKLELCGSAFPPSKFLSTSVTCFKWGLFGSRSACGWELADLRCGLRCQLDLPLFLLSLPKPRSASVLRLIAVIKFQPNMH